MKRDISGGWRGRPDGEAEARVGRTDGPSSGGLSARNGGGVTTLVTGALRPAKIEMLGWRTLWAVGPWRVGTVGRLNRNMPWKVSDLPAVVPYRVADCANAPRRESFVPMSEGTLGSRMGRTTFRAPGMPVGSFAVHGKGTVEASVIEERARPTASFPSRVP